MKFLELIKSILSKFLELIKSILKKCLELAKPVKSCVYRAFVFYFLAV